jgi:hypothetical protein
MRAKLGGELAAIGTILALYLIAVMLIAASRPVRMRVALSAVDSVLQRDRRRFDAELQQWRGGMLDDARWAASLVGLVLDARAAPAPRALSSAEIARLRTLILAQMPTARLWVLDTLGVVRASIGDWADTPSERHRSLARASLARDTALLAAGDVRGNDLRLAVASPVRTPSGRGLVVVLDRSASAVLAQRLPEVSWEGHYGRSALTFQFDKGFVGATWSGSGDDPQISWPAGGWSLADSSLIAVGGELPDIAPRFELAMPRAAALSQVETGTAWMQASAALVALGLCLTVLLVGRRTRNRRLRATEKSLAESQVRAARAESAATRAGLAALQARLNPHFLSNALHSVAALIATDPVAAEEALDRLGDLFRYALEQSERRAVSLDEEWRFVKDYLAIEQMRLGRRLKVEMSLEPDAADCEVPPFVLQPLVENAIRHGVSPRREGGTVRVAARRVGHRVELLVSDDGPGADLAAVSASSGTGLRTLRQRLALDGEARPYVDIDTAPEAGFRVRLTFALLDDAAARATTSGTSSARR